MTLAAPVLLGVLVATLVAVFVTASGVRQLFRQREWRSASTVSFVLAGSVSGLVDLLVTFSNGWIVERDPFNNVVSSFPGWALLAQRSLFVLLLGAAVVVLVVRLRRPGARLHVPALMFVLIAGMAEASAVLRGDNPLQPFYVIPVVVLAATTVAPRGLPVVAGLSTFCATVACATGFAAVFFADFSVLPCGIDKCGIGGANFRGVFDNENALALYLALAMPFVWLAFGRRRGVVLVGYFLFLVLLTGSRTGTLAAVVTFVVLLVVQPDLRTPHFSRGRAAFLYSVLSVALAVGLTLPLVTQNPAALTGRGYLWILARQQLADPVSLLLGRGTFGWQHVRETGLIDFSAVYSVHNQWLDVAFKAGIVGVLLALVGLGLLVLQAGRRHGLVVGAALIPVVCLGVTERPWAIDYTDWLVWALPAALLCFPTRSAEGGSSSPGSTGLESTTQDQKILQSMTPERGGQ